MSDGLYHERIVALAKGKAGAGRLAAPTATARRDNPLCGDRVTVELRLSPDGRVEEMAHQVRGCALCQASASALTSRLVGGSGGAIRVLRAEIDGVLDGSSAGEGDFAAFAPVKDHKSRRDCVTLPFEAVRGAVEEAGF